MALLVLAAAAVAVAVVRYRGRAAAPGAMVHQHEASPASGTGAPVMLSAADQHRIGVTFAAVTYGPVERTVRVVGLVREDETRVRTVTTRLDGFVEALDADFTGQLVHAGQRLLGLYSPEALAGQNELLLAIGLEKSLQAGDPEGLRAARRGVDAARQRLRQWSIPDEVIAEVERTGQPMRVLPLRSPWNGFVLEKNVMLGQRLMAGDAVYRLADLGVVWVEGEVFDQDFALVHTGLHVAATFQALPGREWHGQVAYVYPTVDPTTRTARIRVELPNAGFALKPGMYGTLQFTATLADGLIVPRSAVVSTGTRNLVFLRTAEGRFEPREVTIGISTGDQVQILSGLAPADTVVASATFLMDAESNLGSMLGGMGGMPGMDMAPKKSDTSPGGARGGHDMESMPGMNHPADSTRRPARPAKRPVQPDHQHH
jgi:Cu(I)/Ag(I) efflux system membrane fusion protein